MNRLLCGIAIVLMAGLSGVFPVLAQNSTVNEAQRDALQALPTQYVPGNQGIGVPKPPITNPDTQAEPEIINNLDTKQHDGERKACCKDASCCGSEQSHMACCGQSHACCAQHGCSVQDGKHQPTCPHHKTGAQSCTGQQDGTACPAQKAGDKSACVSSGKGTVNAEQNKGKSMTSCPMHHQGKAAMDCPHCKAMTKKAGKTH
jgi:hypothetical protein